MDRHLFTLTAILAIAITLIHKLVQSEAPIHQNSYNTAKSRWVLVIISALSSVTIMMTLTCLPVLTIH